MKTLLGNVLLSQDPAVQVPSALEGLTVVFGMGTRGSPPPSSPNRVTYGGRLESYPVEASHHEDGLFPQN